MPPPAPVIEETQAITPHLTLEGHDDWIHGVVHLPDGRRIITCSRDGSLRLWDLENGEQIGDDCESGRHKLGVHHGIVSGRQDNCKRKH
jgi:WD40 repeat protein